MKRCPTCGKEYQTTSTLCPNDGTVLERIGDDLVGTTLAGKYRIEEHISDGGMGTVYRATHVLMDKTVAIKVLHPSLAADDKIVQRFTREAKASSRISHPHALNVTDFGESEDGVVFLVMEYLRGETLKDIIRRDGPMPLARASEIIRQVAGALSAAHSEGIVHRDLKSDNIMLDEFGVQKDWAKVLDFGIAKVKEPEGKTNPALTAPNLVIGTPQYMSPEQCSHSSDIDSRSDIYSLGIILYEMLTGHVPFTGDSPTAIMMKHLQDEPPSVLTERPDLPAQVDEIIQRAMAKRPEDRFESATDVADALADAVTLEDQAKQADVSPVAAGATTDKANTTEIVVESGDTNRIVVPTAANDEAHRTASEEQDEETIVHPSVFEAEQFTSSPASSFNPARIAIPAIIFIIGLFVVVYALTRNSDSQPTGNQAAPLTSDPNSQPAQRINPPTGEAERGIGATQTNANANASQTDSGFAPPPTVQGDPLSSPVPPLNNTNAQPANSNARPAESAEPPPSDEDENPPTEQPSARPTPPVITPENPLPTNTPRRRQQQQQTPLPPPPSSDTDHPASLPSTQSPSQSNEAPESITLHAPAYTTLRDGLE
jgi:eukaryotic-like serine/threonine-protein kinase